MKEEYASADKRNDLRQRTKLYARQVIRLFPMLPKRDEALIIGRQLLRSGTSVGANYREAYRARSDAEFLAKLGDSLKELEESQYWLELLLEGNLCHPDRLAPVLDETNQLIAIFVTIINRRKANLRSSS